MILQRGVRYAYSNIFLTNQCRANGDTLSIGQIKENQFLYLSSVRFQELGSIQHHTQNPKPMLHMSVDPLLHIHCRLMSMSELCIHQPSCCVAQ